MHEEDPTETTEPFPYSPRPQSVGPRPYASGWIWGQTEDKERNRQDDQEELRLWWSWAATPPAPLIT